MSAPVRIVVVAYHSGEALRAFLESLPKAGDGPFTVVVADNGAPEGHPTPVDDPAVTVLTMPGNVGYGAAANAGAQGATEPWLLVANPDVVWSPSAIDTLLEAADRWPQAGAFGPRILTPDRDLYPSARAFPSVGRGIGHAAFGWIWPRNPWTRAYRREHGEPREGETGWLSGSCMLLRREAFEAVGGFDTSYFMYCEDMDLCRRIAEAGWENVYVPSATVIHIGADSTKRHPRRMLAAHHRSLYRYLARQYAGARYLPLRLALRAGLAAHLALAAVVRKVAAGAAPTRRADT